MRLLFSAVLAAALSVTATADAKQHVTRQIPVDDSFLDGKIRWTGAPPSYEYKLRPILVDGIVEICGAGVFRTGYLRRETETVLSGYTLFFGDEAYLKDFRFFTKVRSVRKLNGAPATCVSTGKPMPKDRNADLSVRNTGKDFFVVR